MTLLDLTSMFGDQFLKKLFGQFTSLLPVQQMLLGMMVSPSRAGDRLTCAADADHVAFASEFESQGRFPVEGTEGHAELIDGQSEIVNLVEIKSGTCPDGGRGKPSQDDKFNRSRYRYLNDIGRRRHGLMKRHYFHVFPISPGNPSGLVWMANSSVSPVMDSTRWICGLVTIRCKWPPRD